MIGCVIKSDIQYEIDLTDEEKIYIVNLEPIRDLQWLLSNATNITGVIYNNEIESMNNQIEKLSREIW